MRRYIGSGGRGLDFLERQARMLGEAIAYKPQFVVTHGMTIDASSESVWPWLVQMGWHRGGWYTAVVGSTNFCFQRTAPAQITLSRSFKIFRWGDFIPDGAPETECSVVVEQLEPRRVLRLAPTSHPPLEWRRNG